MELEQEAEVCIKPADTINKNFTFFIVLFLVPIAQSALDLYSPSLPNIAHYFNATGSLVQKTTSIFLFALGIGQFFYGSIADSFGRKKVLTFGLLLFTISTFFGLFIKNIELLFVVRFVQGFSLASSTVLTKAIAVDIFSGKKLTQAGAWIGLTWGISPILLPIVGGYLDDFGGWKFSFLAMFLYGFASFVLVAFFLKETIHSKSPFVLKKSLHNSYLIFKNKEFLCSTFIVALTTLAFILFNTAGPFIIQTTMKKSAVFFGYMAFIVGAAYVIGAFCSKFAVEKYRGRTILRRCCYFLLYSSAAHLVLACFYPLSLFLFMLITAEISFMCGFIYAFLLARMYAPFQTELSGSVGSCYGIISYGFFSVMSCILSYIKINSVIGIFTCFLFIGIGCLVSSKIMDPKLSRP